ncbi:MAG: 3-deoxy-D-manno-octulosonate 8-phosphate phosphatase [Candidatus Aminicenantes bacterium]|nr:3-deoxy-D-manno-octulosonate 8-phosphate phosphatase [Candidatus Aminicenantes bacterium]
MRAKARARRVKMILTDVDGTLTDGRLFVLPDGREVKSYHVQDGLAVLLAQLAGLKLGIITGKTSEALEHRAARLRIDELHQGAVDKLPVFRRILEKHGLSAEETAFIGDDVGDLAVLGEAGLAAAVADAHPAVLRRVHYVCRKKGGDGAFREFVDFILGAQKKWGLVTEGFSEIFNRKIDRA